jgi:Ion channel
MLLKATLEKEQARLEKEQARLKKELRRTRNRVRYAIFNMISLQVFTWTIFLLFDKQSSESILFIFPAILALLLAVPPMVNIIKERGKNWVLAAVLANAFLLVWCDFSIVYWGIGTVKNFGANLSRLDAIYFSLGTLSTAGTGRIVAQSELATGIVTAQMLVDLLLVSVVVAIGVSRLGEGLKERVSDSVSGSASKSPVPGNEFGAHGD